MDHRLNLGAWRKVFAVPSCVVDDHHLKLASGTQIKVLLYLLAYPDVGIRSAHIADAVGISADDAEDALLYWVNAGILTQDDHEYYPGRTATAAPAAVIPQIPAKQENPLDTPEARAYLSSDTHFPPKVIAGAVNSDKAVKYLFEMYEKLAGRPLKHAEKETLMILVEEIGLPCEITMMLVEYCFRIDRSTPAYMKAVARDWCENGIDTIGKAEERIKLLQSRFTLENRLRKKFDITSSFSAKQKEIISGWSDLDISEALIDEAYDRMLTNTGKLSLPYMDKILRKWHEDGITDPSQLEKAKKEPDPAQSGTSYSISDLEQQSLDLYRKSSG